MGNEFLEEDKGLSRFLILWPEAPVGHEAAPTVLESPDDIQ
jgi:hypothetical protein